MSGKTGGEGVDLSPMGDFGTGVGPLGAGVSPILPTSPEVALWVVWAKTGEANANELTRATLERVDIFNIGN